MGGRSTKEPESLRLVGYARVSTEDQATTGVSLAAQEVRLKAHAKAHGYRLLRIETDEGVSGKVPPSRRPGLRRALDAVKDKKADGIAFLKLDRLSRSVRDILSLADDAQRRGSHIVSVHEHIDTSSAAGRFTLGVLALLAQMEREQVGERTVMGMAQVAREGRARSRFLPFGYRIKGADKRTVVKAGDRRQLVEHPAEMRLLRRMQKLRAEGLGARRIARELNAKGTNPRTGRPWNPSTVAALLRTAKKRAAALAT